MYHLGLSSGFTIGICLDLWMVYIKTMLNLKSKIWLMTFGSFSLFCFKEVVSFGKTSFMKLNNILWLLLNIFWPYPLTKCYLVLWGCFDKVDASEKRKWESYYIDITHSAGFHYYKHSGNEILIFLLNRGVTCVSLPELGALIQVHCLCFLDNAANISYFVEAPWPRLRWEPPRQFQTELKVCAEVWAMLTLIVS